MASMVVAKLFARSQHIAIYFLERQGDSSEVYDFLNRSTDPKMKGYVKGFIQLLQRILDGDWHRLSEYFKKTWDVDGVKFTELLKKGSPWRIGCVYDASSSKLFLATVFRKHRRMESREYHRAVHIYQDFCSAPIWEE
jgi:hypothetical protein